MTNTTANLLLGKQTLVQKFGLGRNKQTVVFVLSVMMTLYQLYVSIVGYPIMFIHRPLHLMLTMIIAFLIAPSGTGRISKTLDTACILVTVAVIGYLVLNAMRIMSRVQYITPLTALETMFGLLFLVVLLEAVRRKIGLVLVIVALIFLVYATKLGSYLPYPFWHKGYTINGILECCYLSMDSVWGTALGVTATYVFLFVLFGCLLSSTGAGNYFTDVANAATGRSVGGPAKAAVVSSALMGTLSGSSVANVVTTGAFTIPLMKRTGYPAHFAGAVEAVASSGGQIMPPVMGAAAFIMVEFTGIPYVEIMKAAVVPALLYFTAAFLMVDIEARKRKLALYEGEKQNVFKVIWGRIYLIVPIVMLVIFLVRGFTLTRAALWASASLIVLCVMFDKRLRRNILAALLEGFSITPQTMCSVSIATATAGIIVGMVQLTGLGMRMSTIVLSVSGGQLAVALVLTMVVALILGMGMPTSSAYIVMATLLAPGLVNMGVSIMGAHMFAFYFACISAITPPVALAAYAAAGIADSNVMKTGYTSFKIGLSAFIVPFAFVYGPELLLDGSAPSIILAVITALAGVYLLAAATELYLLGVGRIHPLAGILLGLGAVTLIIPGLWTDFIGLGIAAVVYAYYLIRKKRKQPLAETA